MKNFYEKNPVVLAHRGDSQYFPENTMPAFLSAQKLGVDIIETDIHLTKDKQIIIWHDDDLQRISGKPDKIEDKTLNELMQLDAGKMFTPDNGKTHPFLNKDIKLVLLKDLLQTLPNSYFNIDMKTDDLELPPLFYNILKECNAINRVCVASFHNRIMLKFREIAPEVITSFSYNEIIRFTLTHKLGLGFLNGKKQPNSKICQIPAIHKGIWILSKSFIQFCKKNKILIQIWTVNDEAMMHKLLDIGVDGIFTDNPRLLQKVLNDRENYKEAERSWQEFIDSGEKAIPSEDVYKELGL